MLCVVLQASQVDIGVVWRAHMMLHCTYKSDILRLQGVGGESKGVAKGKANFVPYIDACATWSWGAQGAQGRNALMRTKDVYVSTFGEPYVTAGSAFSAPLSKIPPPTSISQDVGSRRNGAGGRRKGPGGTGNVQDNIHPKNTHRALLASTSFQIVIDLVGPFGTCLSLLPRVLLQTDSHAFAHGRRGRQVPSRPSVSRYVVSAYAHQRGLARRDKSIDSAINACAHWRGCWRAALPPRDHV